MNYTEDELLPLSGLQHLIFCERQCALIHIEQAWVENRLTAEGRIMHEWVDSKDCESRGNVRIEYSIPLRSLRLGLVGKADVVEFHRKPIPGKEKHKIWVPFPVEYKRGKPKKDNSDKVQLCAQALCLEEMMKIEIPEGALFYGKTRRRLDIPFGIAMRQETEDAAKQLHDLFESGRTPRPVYTKKCDRCSFIDTCLPKALGKTRSVDNYLLQVIGKS